MSREYWILKDKSDAALKGNRPRYLAEEEWSNDRKEAYHFRTLERAKDTKKQAGGRIVHVTVKPPPCLSCERNVNERVRAVAILQNAMDLVFTSIELEKYEEETAHVILDVLNQCRTQIIGSNGLA